MKKYIVEKGQRFGMLTVIKEFYSKDYRGNNERRVACLCDCGNLMDTRISSLFKFTKSCGCYRRENSANMLRSHGLSKFPVYKLFMSIKKRCYNPACKSYPDYGGRGIIICSEWLINPESFCCWASSNGYKKGLTIERKDNNEGYSPDNCFFTDRIRQANNTRNNRIIEYDGEKMSMADFCRKWDLNYDMFRQRLDEAKKPVSIAMVNCGHYNQTNKTEKLNYRMAGKKEDSLYERI